MFIINYYYEINNLISCSYRKTKLFICILDSYTSSMLKNPFIYCCIEIKYNNNMYLLNICVIYYKP